jgi:hypothetical protein
MVMVQMRGRGRELGTVLLASVDAPCASDADRGRGCEGGRLHVVGEDGHGRSGGVLAGRESRAPVGSVGVRRDGEGSREVDEREAVLAPARDGRSLASHHRRGRPSAAHTGTPDMGVHGSGDGAELRSTEIQLTLRLNGGGVRAHHGGGTRAAGGRGATRVGEAALGRRRRRVALGGGRDGDLELDGRRGEAVKGEGRVEGGGGADGGGRGASPGHRRRRGSLPGFREFARRRRVSGRGRRRGGRGRRRVRKVVGPGAGTPAGRSGARPRR